MEDPTPNAPEGKACSDGQNLDPKKTESTSPAGSGDSILLLDNPYFIPPDQQDILLMDVNSNILHTTISGVLGVQYLSSAERLQPTPLFGRIHGLNKRLMVNVITRRRCGRGGSAEYPYFNVFFLCDTAVPNTFICEEAMKVLLGEERAGDVVPGALFVQMSDFPAVEAHLSPKGSRFEDVNVIGMDLMSQLKTTIVGPHLEFQLENM